MTILALFLLAQILDGALTYIGISRGYPEGNPLLVWAIETHGPATALVGAKVFSALCGAGIYYLGATKTLFVITSLVYGVAVLPWMAALVS